MKNRPHTILGFLLLVILLASGCQKQTPDLTISTPTEETSTELPSQTNEEGNVTIEITPLAYDQTEWRFEVTLETHSVELNNDMVEASVLSDASGNQYKPDGWEGDAAGGHHRSGELIFREVPSSASFQLDIQGIATIEHRIFKWDLPENL